jgi:preprotein translocase subunit SecE
MADEINKEVTKKTADAAKKANKPKKEGNIFSRAWKRIKKFFKDEKGECKKVVWPNAKTVVKSSCVVLAVVIVVGLVIYGFDTGISQLLGLLKSIAEKAGDNNTTEAAEGMIRAFLGF